MRYPRAGAAVPKSTPGETLSKELASSSTAAIHHQSRSHPRVIIATTRHHVASTTHAHTHMYIENPSAWYKGTIIERLILLVLSMLQYNVN